MRADTGTGPAGRTDAAAQVLVITGSDPYLPAFIAIDGAMRSAMARRYPRSVTWLHESIDAIRLGGEPGLPLAELLAKKYEAVRIDAVVLATEPSVRFYLRFREHLWPGAAVVFHSVSPDFASQLQSVAGLAGLPADLDFAGALRIAFKLQPRARRLVVVGGVSQFDEMQNSLARSAAESHAGRISVEYLIGLPARNVAERLARETPETVVLYTSFFRDIEGDVYTPREVLEMLRAASGAPIYGVHDSYMGHGITAGAIESFRDRGERVADILMRTLDGARGDNAIIEPPPPSKCLADGRELKRLGLSARQLGADCEVRYVEPTLLQRYWWQSLLVALALVGQTLLIAALLLQRRRRRAAELGLQAQRVQLLHASRLAVAGELTASIAHEINQPLGAILANADAAELLVNSGQIQRDELLQILADIRRDDLRASEVIKGLRSMLARHEVERRRFNLNQAVEDASAILRAEARRRAAAIDYVLRAQQADVLGDPVQIQQVIINLMLNAFDASAELLPEQRRIRVETSDTPPGVQLSIRDFGSGIAPKDLPHVFESFFSTKSRGMGLGLSIARSIVEAHGGTIAAANREVGAEFHVTLPLAPSTADAGQLLTIPR